MQKEPVINTESDPENPPKPLQTLTLVEWDSGDGEPTLAFGTYDERYRVEDFVGEGGMGEVYRGRDTILRRNVAIKYLKVDRAGDAKARGQFWHEAVHSGILDHPCIPPLHDLGVDSEDRPFYVMRFIRGTSLGEVLRLPEAERWSLPRLLQVLIQVCGAVQFAHESGILHLDLKPENIMLGEYGDVYVVDWGLAESTDKPSKSEGPRRPRGTPAYMSPEQARADADLTPRADVFALGVILYEMVTGTRPFTADSIARLLQRIQSDDFERGAEWEKCPAELQELIEGALAKPPGERVADARSIANRVQDFLEGRKEQERRTARAQTSFEKAERELERCTESIAAAEKLASQLESIQLEPWAEVSEKRELWNRQDAIQDHRRTADIAVERALHHLRDAQKDTPNDHRVRTALADIYWDRFLLAEQQGDEFQQRFLETQLRELDLPHINEGLEGNGTLSIACTPAPAEAFVEDLVQRDRLLVAANRRELDSLDQAVLPMGRYQVTLSRPGYESLVAPVYIGRGEHVVREWRMRTGEEIGDEFALVPSGPFVMGGDTGTVESVPRQIRHVAEFCIARYPVTWRQYRDYLQAIADVDRDEAERRLPDVSHNTPDAWAIDEDGRLQVEVDEEDWEFPIFKVTYEDALAYCAWRSKVDGRAYRLPTDEEWEKAARGEDARIFPWGDHFDATFCKNAQSRPERAQPESVGAYEKDCSPYGVRDMAGGIREWCGSWFNEANGHRLVRGGSWNFGPIGAHCAYRLGCGPTLSYPFIGFRLAHTIE